MTQYTVVNAKLSESQLSKLRSAASDDTGVTLRLSVNMFGIDENEYPHKLLLTNTQVKRLRNRDIADIKFSKTQIKKLTQSGGFLGSLLGPLMKFALPLAKNVLLPLGLTAAASATDAGIKKSIHGSGSKPKSNSKLKSKPKPKSESKSKPRTTRQGVTLTIPNRDLDDIMKIIKCLEDHDILIKGVAETVKNETKEQKGGFLGMLLGTLGASLLGNLLTGKGVIRAGEGIIRAGQDF